MRHLRELRQDNRGSVVVIIVFIVAVVGFGLIYTWIKPAWEAIADVTTTEDSTFDFLYWYLSFGIIIVFLIGCITWLVSQLQKSRYREE